MRKRNILLIVLLLLITITAYPQQRSLQISGLRNYTEDELFEALNLYRYEDGVMSAKEVVDSIISFYGTSGYTLIKVYVIEKTDTSLEIFVDEGMRQLFHEEEIAAYRNLKGTPLLVFLFVYKPKGA